MKVYLQPDVYSRGIVRVANALMQYAPSSLQLVSHASDADLEVIHVYGRHDTVSRRIELLRQKKKPFAMIQYCLRSTMCPSTWDWFEMWEKAKLVWSYYDLPELCRQDGIGSDLPDGSYTMPGFNFYHAPLGVDPKIFRDTNIEKGARILINGKKRFVILASAQHALSESARECAFAAKRVKRSMFFLGHELRRGPDIVCKNNLTDEQVADYYSQCEFISGLRRIEGFELPVIEGALCGARPIVFDRQETRKWFSDFAIFIPETNRDGVISELELIFNENIPPISDKQKDIIRDRFNWETIIKNFWNKIL